MNARVWMALSFLLASALGCSESEKESPTASARGTTAETAEQSANDQTPSAAPTGPQDEAAVAEAQKLFDGTCAVCHGPTGRGDGAGAASLTPKPRDFTDSEWQASVTDEDIEKVVLGGGLAVGKSPVMPATPQLKNQPHVLDALVRFIRSIEGQG